MKMEIVTQVYKTCDYDEFKILDANRDVKDKRIARIKKSFESVGYVVNPIIVNEEYSVIDGQGRLAACKEMGIPVYFIVVGGVNIKQCREMNRALTNWNMEDHIKSYAKDKDNNCSEDYERLMRLREKYKNLPVGLVSGVASGGAYMIAKNVANGEFVCSEADFKRAEVTLDYLNRLRPYIQKVRGRKDCLYIAITWLIKFELIEKDILYKQFSNYYSVLPPVADQPHAVGVIETLYNYNRRNKIFFVSDYKKKMAERNCFGESSWSMRNFNESKEEK